MLWLFQAILKVPFLRSYGPKSNQASVVLQNWELTATYCSAPSLYCNQMLQITPNVGLTHNPGCGFALNPQVLVLFWRKQIQTSLLYINLNQLVFQVPPTIRFSLYQYLYQRNLPHSFC